MNWLYTGLSARLEFDFNDIEDFSFANNMRLLAGLEARFYPPPSNLVFSFLAGIAVHGNKSGGFGGIGIGVIF
jgi:hypothetical protein